MKKLKTIYLIQQKRQLPYFVLEMEVSDSGHGMILLEEVADRTAADRLAGKEIFVEPSLLKKGKPFSTPADFIGFEISDVASGLLGVLEDIKDLPGHAVGQFTFSDKEVLFPWTEEVVQRIDKKRKTVLLKLPEGLLEVYAGKERS